jgi:hypothetical protein
MQNIWYEKKSSWKFCKIYPTPIVLYTPKKENNIESNENISNRQLSAEQKQNMKMLHFN